MKYISLFSGIEAASQAFRPLGWKAVAFSEIEPFPCAVLKHYYPEVPNLGDITKVKWSKWRGKADLVCGGSPCQSFSIAGLRQGLKDPRGNLTLSFLKAIDQIQPKYVLMENVPGILSDDNGKTIQIVIDALTQMGYTVDIDILDAQYFGVPQKRRRMFLICVKLEDLLKKRTPTSNRIITEILVQALLSIWDVIQPVSSQERSRLELEYPIVPSAGSALKRISLLNGLLGGSAVTKLLDYFQENHPPYMGELCPLKYVFLLSCEVQPQELKTDINGCQSQLREKEYGNKNIERMSRKELVDLWEAMSKSTILTSINSTTKEKICSFVQASLNIVQSIIDSEYYYPERKLSSDSWNLAFFLLMFLREVTNYAEQASCELFSTERLRNDWGDCQRQAEYNFILIERYIREWASSEEILSFKKSLFGNPAAGGEAGKEITGTLSARNKGGGGLGTDFELSGGIVMSTGQGGAEIMEDKLPTLNCNHEAPICFSIQERACSENIKAGPQGKGFQQNKAYTLESRQTPQSVVYENHASRIKEVGIAPQLNARAGTGGGNLPLVQSVHQNQSGELQVSDKCNTVGTTSNASARNTGKIMVQSTIRRLTVEECEALQGFPRGFTRIPYKNKPADKCPDGPRYKSIGNSWAVPVAAWIAGRINQIDKEAAK